MAKLKSVVWNWSLDQSTKTFPEVSKVSTQVQFLVLLEMVIGHRTLKTKFIFIFMYGSVCMVWSFGMYKQGLCDDDVQSKLLLI